MHEASMLLALDDPEDWKVTSTGHRRRSWGFSLSLSLFSDRAVHLPRSSGPNHMIEAAL